MRKKLPVLLLVLTILLQAFVPVAYAASKNEEQSQTAYFCLSDATSEGAGSTGRTEANTLNEQFGMQQVMSDPLEGATVLREVVLNDPRWPATDGWVKMQNIVVTSEGKIIIHFNYNSNTGATADFKFV